MREMLEGGELDVLTGDYLAELTMLILGRDRLRDSSLGYARTFLRQLEDCLGLALDAVSRSSRTPADSTRTASPLPSATSRGGLASTRRSVRRTATTCCRAPAELGYGEPVAANAYLGGWGIAACLRAGADVVVTGRVTDASLVVGPAAARFGWSAG